MNASEHIQLQLNELMARCKRDNVEIKVEYWKTNPQMICAIWRCVDGKPDFKNPIYVHPSPLKV